LAQCGGSTQPHDKLATTNPSHLVGSCAKSYRGVQQTVASLAVRGGSADFNQSAELVGRARRRPKTITITRRHPRSIDIVRQTAISAARTIARRPWKPEATRRADADQLPHPQPGLEAADMDEHTLQYIA
jgi:hypothetical protein